MYKNLLLFGLSLSLGACNYLAGESGMFRDRVGDYTDAQIAPQMEIPAGLDSYTLDQLYVIPEAMEVSAEPFAEVPLPKPIETRRREGVTIQSLAEHSWILIDATQGQVWPLIRDYWTELQIALDYENPSSGIMETSWLEVGSDLEKRHKYRIQIEPGLHSGYSEIYVVHLENLRSDPIPTVISWPEQSNSADLERDILTSISQYLADRNDIYQASSASLLAGSIEAESKANLVQTASGSQVLELKVDYNRAWAQVRQALDVASIEIIDSDRDQAVINVRFAGIAADEDAPGFIGRLLNRGDDSAAPVARDFSVRILETGPVINVVAEALESAEPTEESARLSLDLLTVINDNLT